MKSKECATGQPLAHCCADGTLDLSSGFRGSLDPAGWRLAGGNNHAPRFIPDTVPTDPGDEYWRPGTTIQTVNDTVEAVGGGRRRQRLCSGGVHLSRRRRRESHRQMGRHRLVALGQRAWTARPGPGGERCRDLYAGGNFTIGRRVSGNSMARWDGVAWSTLGSGDEWHQLHALAVDGAGNLYAGGGFTTAGGVAPTVAKWDGIAWSGLGGGNGGQHVYALAVDAAGNLYAGGNFAGCRWCAANNIAKWDGSAWSALGAG